MAAQCPEGSSVPGHLRLSCASTPAVGEELLCGGCGDSVLCFQRIRRPVRVALGKAEGTDLG